MAAISRAAFLAAATTTGDLRVLEAYFAQDHVGIDVARVNAHFHEHVPSINIYDEGPVDPWYFVPETHGSHREFIFTKALAIGLTEVIEWFYAPTRIAFLGPTLAALLPFTGALAADEDQVGVIETLVTSEVYVTVFHDDQHQQVLNSMLCVAIERNHHQVIDVLVAHGASVNPTSDDSRDNPLASCAAIGNEDTVAALIQHGAFAVGENLLIHASYLGNEESACELLRSGVDWGNHAGQQNPLHAAAEDGHADLVRIYLEDGFADVDARNSRGETALMMATWQTQADRGAVGPESATIVTRVLLDFGADISLRDIEGNTALHHAVGTEHTIAFALLLQEGLNPNDRNNQGCSVLDMLPLIHLDNDEDGNERVQVELLINYGADVFARGPDGTCAIERLQTTDTGRNLLTKLASGCSLHTKCMASDDDSELLACN